MPLWLSIALPFVVMVLSVTMTAIVNMKIKFAPSLEAAKGDLKLLGLQVTSCILNLISFGFVVYGLFLDVFSSEPLTRVTVFVITIRVAILMLQVMFLIVVYFINRTRNQIHNDIKNIFSDIRELTGIACGLKSIQSDHLVLIKNTSDTLFNHLDVDHLKVPPS